MGVLAATFPRASDAEHAACLLHERLRLAPEGVRLARLGAAGRPEDGAPLLAAVVPDPELPAAVELLTDAGGTIVETQAEAPSGLRAIDDRGA